MSRIVEEWRNKKQGIPMDQLNFTLWVESQIKIGDRMADEIERLERLVGLYRLRETLRFHPSPEAAVRLREVNEQIAKEEQHG